MASRGHFGLSRLLGSLLHSPGTQRAFGGLSAFRQFCTCELESELANQLEAGSNTEIDGKGHLFENLGKSWEGEPVQRFAANDHTQTDQYSNGGNELRNGQRPIPGVYKAVLLGEVGYAPFQRLLKGGTTVTVFTVGTGGMRHNRRPYEGETPGEDEQSTAVQWHRIVIYQSKLAALALRYARPGSRVYIEGNLEMRSLYGPEPGSVKRFREIAVRHNGQFLCLDPSTNKSSVNEMVSNEFKSPAAL